MLNASVGLSTDSNSRNAGKQIVKEALDGLTGHPKLAILAIDHLTRKKYNYSDIIAAVHEDLDSNVPIIGSSASGIMVNNRLALKSAGLMLIGGDIDIDATFCYEKSRKNHIEIGDKLLETRKGLTKKENQIALIFQDGPKFLPEVIAKQRSLNSRAVSIFTPLVNKVFKKQLEEFWDKGLGFPSVQELLGYLFNRGWDIPILGSCATNPDDFMSYEFYNNKVLEDAVLGVIMSGSGNTKFGYSFIQGAVPTGISCEPTKNIGNFILRIDGKPALQGFCNAFNIEKESLKELENQGFLNYYQVFGTKEVVDGKDFYHLTLTLTDPELESLIISGFPFDKVPQKIELFYSNTKMILQSAEDVLKESIRNVKEPRFLFGIDCVLRWSSMGDNLEKYIETIRNVIGKDTPTLMVGAGGEIYGSKSNDYYNNNMTFIPFIGGQ